MMIVCISSIILNSQGRTMSIHHGESISIGLVRNFLRFFRKFPGTAENVLEYSILGVYIDGMNTVRMTIKLSKWKLISN